MGDRREYMNWKAETKRRSRERRGATAGLYDLRLSYFEIPNTAPWMDNIPPPPT